MMIKKLQIEILNLGENNCFFYFGNLGKVLYDFFSKVDSEHPDLLKLELKDQSIFDFLILINSVKEKNKFLANLISKNFNQDFNFLNCSRILKKEHRKNSRSKKKSFQFKSKYFYSFAEKYWDSIPDDFSMFRRFDLKYHDKIKKNNEVLNCFKEVGLCLFEKEILDANSFLKSEFDSYLGFKRIKISDALLIIAKINKLEFSKIENSNLLVKKSKNKIEIFKPKVNPITNLNKEFLKFEEELEGNSSFDNYICLDSGFPEDNKKIVLGEKDGVCYFLYD